MNDKLSRQALTLLLVEQKRKRAHPETPPTFSLKGDTLWMNNGHGDIALGRVAGAPGTDGDKGDDGVAGVSPETPEFLIEQGELYVSQDDEIVSLGRVVGRDGKDGIDGTGRDGKDGNDGLKGDAGVSPELPIFAVREGHLYAGNDRIGRVVAARGDRGARGQAGKRGAAGKDGTNIEDVFFRDNALWVKIEGKPAKRIFDFMLNFNGGGGSGGPPKRVKHVTIINDTALNGGEDVIFVSGEVTLILPIKTKYSHPVIIKNTGVDQVRLEHPNGGSIEEEPDAIIPAKDSYVMAFDGVDWWVIG